MKFKNPDGKITVSKIGDHFVDDRASGVTANTTNKTLLQQLKHDEQKHAILLFSAGYKLTLDKCSFYYYGFLRKGTRSIHTCRDRLPGGLGLQEYFDRTSYLSND